MKRALALFLSLVMCLSLFPTGAFAEGIPVFPDFSVAEEPEITEKIPELLTVPEAEEEISALSDEGTPEEPEIEILSDVIDEMTEPVPEAETKETASEEETAGILAPETELFVGETMQLSLSEDIIGSEVVWSSSDEAVLTVDETGLVTALNEGVATVYADVNGEVLSFDMTVISEEFLTAEAPVYAASSGKCGENLTWTLDDEGTLTVSGVGEMYNYEKDTPWILYTEDIKNIIIEPGVTSIGDYAFAICSSLTEIEIPDSVTSLGDYSFYGCDLADVTIGRGVTNIGDYAFEYCDSLTRAEYAGTLSQWMSISVGEGNDRLLDALLIGGEKPGYFGKCGDNLLWTLDENGILTIRGSGAMEDYGDGYAGTEAHEDGYAGGGDNDPKEAPPWRDYLDIIRCVKIEEGITHIGDYAFYDCYNLTDADIPDSVTSLGDSAFYGCKSLTYVTIPDSVISIGDSAFGCCDISEIKIPDSVASLGNCAFYDCYRLTDVTIGSGITNIGDYAFEYCDSLTRAEYAGTLSQWMSISVGEGNDRLLDALLIDGIKPGYFGKCGDNLLWTLDDDGILSIRGSGAMEDYGDGYAGTEAHEDGYAGGGDNEPKEAAPWRDHLDVIRCVKIEDGITHIGDYAFYDCYNLTDADIPDSVTSLGDSAFRCCDSLTEIEIPDSVTSLGDYSFCGCRSLSVVTIGSGVTEIGNGAFYDCFNLSEVHYTDNEARWNAISIGSGNESLYNAVIRFNSSGSIITGFCGEKLVWTLNESGTLMILGNGRMEWFVTNTETSWSELCDRVVTVYFSSGITEIAGYEFENCRNLRRVYYSGTLEQWDSIEKHGEEWLRNAEVYTGASFTMVSGKTDYNVTWKLDADGTFRVSGSGMMSDYGLGNEGGYAYGYEFLSKEAAPWLKYREAINRVEIEEGITYIGSYAFMGCFDLLSVEIPGSVTSIGDCAFGDCFNLSEIHYADNETRWNAVNIGSGNESLYNAVIRFNFSGSIITGFCGEKLVWTLNESGTLMILGNGRMQGFITDTETPWYELCDRVVTVYFGSGITEIAGYEFENCRNLRRVYYSGTLEQWDSIAKFGDEWLRNAEVYTGASCTMVSGKTGNDLTWELDADGTLRVSGSGMMSDYGLGNEGGYAYGYEFLSKEAAPWLKYREAINRVEIEEGITYIGNCAFYGCPYLERADISNSVEGIGRCAFSVSGLKILNIGSGVRYISHDMLDGCYELTDIFYAGTREQWNAMEGAASIGGNFTLHFDSPRIRTAGSYGDNITWTLSTEGVLTVTGTGAMTDSQVTSPEWELAAKYAESLIIDFGITHIGDAAFEYFDALTDVKIPDSVTSIGRWAFEGCSSLTEISIPDSVTSIGGYAFCDCSSLTGVEIPDNVTYIEDYSFSSCRALTNVTIPGHVTSIGDDAFNYCSSLIGVTIPDSVTSIGDYAFAWCEAMSELTLGKGVKDIGTGAFEYCTSLTDIEIPESVTSIGSSAFMYCEKIKEIFIPAGVESIGSEAFFWCNSLLSIDVSENNIYYCGRDGVLFDSSGTVMEAFPAGRSGSYRIPDGVERIGKQAFSGCASITEVTIPGSVKIIDEYAFFVCKQLQSISIPDSVKSIGKGAFAYCSSLRDVYYTGTRSQWDAIAIYQGNEPLASAEIHCMGEEPAVPQLTLSSTDVTLELGETVQLRAYLDGTDVTHTVTWTITNTDVAQFSGLLLTGLVLTGINPGTAIVTARYCVGGSDITAQCLINVIPQPISTLIITKDLPTSYTVYENEIVTLSIEATGGSGPISYQWYSSRGPLSCTSPSITFLLSAPEVIWCVVTSGEQTVESMHCQLIPVPESTPKFIVSDSGGNPGKTAIVRVSIENNPGIVGLTLGFVYDRQVFTLSRISTAGLSGTWETGKKVTWASDRGDQFFNGTILYLEFEIADNAPLGTYPIGVSFSGGDICNDAVQPVGFTASSGSITVNSHIPGDVNGDGFVGTKDFLTLMQYCADKENIVYDPNALDINNDGYVNTMDFITLMQYLAGREIKIY